MLTTLIVAAVAMFIYSTGWFFVSRILHRSDVADIAWGVGFIIVSVATIISTHTTAPAAYLTAVLVTIWGLRLASHIGRRNLKKPEDDRYIAMRERWPRYKVLRTYIQVFLSQGLLILLIGLPIMIINTCAQNGLNLLTILGVIIWVLGFCIEAIADRQLRDYIALPEKPSRFMMSGLWSYSRHPNYFGEVTLWWGIGLICLSVPYGWIGLIGPLTISYLIIFVSGVPLLERKYKDNLEFQKYARRTSILIPFPPRSGHAK
jgi:steroid 5-alpha reductase family enzyme